MNSPSLGLHAQRLLAFGILTMATLTGCDSNGDDEVIRFRGIEDGGVYTDRVRVEVLADADDFLHVDLHLVASDSLGGVWQQEPPFVFEGFPFLDTLVGVGDIEVTACGLFRSGRSGDPSIQGACTAPIRVRVERP